MATGLPTSKPIRPGFRRDALACALGLAALLFAGAVRAADSPVTIVVLGATGDLSGRLLTPALTQIVADLPPGSRVVGAGLPSTEFAGDAGFSDWLKQRVSKLTGKLDEARWSSLAKLLHFQPIDLTDASSFVSLKQRLELIDAEDRNAGRLSGPRRVVFYYAIAPSLIAATTDNLVKVGLIGPHTANDVVPEKPLGKDERSAGELVAKVVKAAGAEHVYFMDHYNGKPGIQRLRQLRADDRFARIWNKRYIEHIEVKALESLGTEGRGAFYDPTGATRDMVQSHLLQTLTFATMEQRADAAPEAVQLAKLASLRSLRGWSSVAGKDAVRGQYQAGARLGDYRKEAGVNPGSATETYVKLRLRSDARAFKNVPITVESGKGLHSKQGEVVVHFRRLPTDLAIQLGQDPQAPATLKIGLDSGAVHLGDQPVVLSGEVSTRSAYANQLLNILHRDHSAFPSAHEIDAAWKLIDPLEQKWSMQGKSGLKAYKAGSVGPKAARRLSWKATPARFRLR